MANRKTNIDLEEIFQSSLEEAKKKSRSRAKKREEEEEEGEGEEEEEEGESSKSGRKKKAMKEETIAAASLHPAARSMGDPKSLDSSKVSMMQQMMGMMSDMNRSEMVDFFNSVIAQYGPNKEYGVGDNSQHNAATLHMKPSLATGSMKEDVEAMFGGEELSEEFKDKATTLFEAAVSARLIAETARLEEIYAHTLNEEIASFTSEITNKMDSYLDYVSQNWLAENEVAIESAIRNELMEEFIDGLRNLFSEHYINVPQEKVDVLEALAEKVSVLEGKLDETITENVQLKNYVLDEQRKQMFEHVASDLALTQQEKFAALSEGIEFNGDLDVYGKKLLIIKENYFKTDSHLYNSNIIEESFEGDIEPNGSRIDPSVNRYVQAIARSVKK